MAIFQVRIDDLELLAGITAARCSFNAAESPQHAFATDEEYVQFLTVKAAEHFTRKYMGSSASHPESSRLTTAKLVTEPDRPHPVETPPLEQKRSWVMRNLNRSSLLARLSSRAVPLVRCGLLAREHKAQNLVK